MENRDFFSFFNEFFNDDFGQSLFNQKSHTPQENDPNFNKVVNESHTDTHIIKEETWTSIDGSQVFKRTVVESKFNKNLKYKKDIKLLQQELNEAVEKQEFEKAAEIRDEINKIKKGE